MGNALKNPDWEVLQEFSEAIAGLGEIASRLSIESPPEIINLALSSQTNHPEEITQ